MTAEVIPIHTDAATPQQVLAHALSLAQKGLLRDVVIVSTDTDGEMDHAFAGCSASDLAVAALYLQHQVRNHMQFKHPP